MECVLRLPHCFLLELAGCAAERGPAQRPWNEGGRL